MAKLSARNTLSELGIGDKIPQQITHLNVVKPTREASLTISEIESWIQNSFRTNKVKKDVLDNFDGSFMGAVTSAELECAVPPLSCLNESSNYYYRSYDGSCNNIGQPAFGMAKSRYDRIVKPNPGNRLFGTSKMNEDNTLPNPRVLSLSLYGEDTFSDSHRTFMLMQFGQFVSHDISQLYSQGLPGE